jgi:hypothetical protein
MNNMNFGDPFLQFGPGLASLWGGEQVGLNFDSQRINQKKGLEDILTAQQTRQQSAELQPFKVDEARIKNQKAKDEITAANLQQFTDAVYQDVLSQGNMQGPPDSVGNAARWSGQAKAMGLDPEDYRVKVILGTAAQGPQGLAKVREALYRMSQKGLEKTDDANRQAATDAAAMGREQAGNASRERVAAGNNATQLRIAEMRKEQALATAQARGQAGAQAAKNRNFQQAWQYYREAAMAAYEAGDNAKGQMFEREAEVALQAAMTAPGNTSVRPGTAVLPPGSGVQQTPAAPMPQAPPLNPAASPQQPAQRQMSPQDQQALQWARSNPQDPRSRAILQKLGVQ